MCENRNAGAENVGRECRCPDAEHMGRKADVRIIWETDVAKNELRR